MTLIRLEGVTKTYAQGEQTRTVLDRVTARFEAGEFVAIRGRSGSGKTTLLNLLAALDTPTAGRIEIEGVDLTSLGERERTLFRRDNIGIVFQFFNLIPTLTVIENVTLPAELSGELEAAAKDRGRRLLEQVGLLEREQDYPERLSGGEQQRVAIARALIQDPALVLADEPTGNLDQATGGEIQALLIGMTRRLGRSLILVTHSHELASAADRVLMIVDGKLAPEPQTAPSGDARQAALRL